MNPYHDPWGYGHGSDDDAYDTDLGDGIDYGFDGQRRNYSKEVMTEKKMEVVVTEVSKLSVKPGEVLIVRFPSTYSQSEIEQIYKAFALALGPTSGARILMVPDDLGISKVEVEGAPEGQSFHPLY